MFEFLDFDGLENAQLCDEARRWRKLMKCETVSDLNRLVQNGEIRKLIRLNEALHEVNYAKVSERICAQNFKLVMLAGPSASGKTTSANRLATQLQSRGKEPLLLSLDDYYFDRDKIRVAQDGQLDLEHINTIDADLFSKQMEDLLCGNVVELPRFNFRKGCREWNGTRLQISANSVIVVEGLHALNPRLLPHALECNLVFRVYVSPLCSILLDDCTQISSSFLRLLRRIVRDYNTRGASVEQTMSMWESVLFGEQRWILPYQETADMIFDSATQYELVVLKTHICPLLQRVSQETWCYEHVQEIMKILDCVYEANIDDEIPPTSLVREFIGGSAFNS